MSLNPSHNSDLHLPTHTRASSSPATPPRRCDFVALWPHRETKNSCTSELIVIDVLKKVLSWMSWREHSPGVMFLLVRTSSSCIVGTVQKKKKQQSSYCHWWSYHNTLVTPSLSIPFVLPPTYFSDRSGASHGAVIKGLGHLRLVLACIAD